MENKNFCLGQRHGVSDTLQYQVGTETSLKLIFKLFPLFQLHLVVQLKKLNFFEIFFQLFAIMMMDAMNTILQTESQPFDMLIKLNLDS